MKTNTNLLNVVNRNCIICNSTEYNSIFTLSDDYNNFFDNSNKDSVKLNSIYGPQKIVECKNCGCCYVKNVVMGITTNSNELHERENEEREKCILEENKLHVENLIKKKFYDPILYKLNNAIRFSKKNPEDMFFFDYGSGTGYVNKLSEILGFKKSYAFDPVYNVKTQESFNKSGFKNIESFGDIDALKEKKIKFDIIWCTAVIEHALSPKKLIEDLVEISHQDTIFVFSNPLMPIKKDAPEMKKILIRKDYEEIKELRRKKRYMHFHLNHINFMGGKQIKLLLDEFNISVIRFYPNTFINKKFNFKMNPLSNFLKKIYIFIFPYTERSDYFLKRRR